MKPIQIVITIPTFIQNYLLKKGYAVGEIIKIYKGYLTEQKQFDDELGLESLFIGWLEEVIENQELKDLLEE